LLELIQPDPQILADGRRRMADMFHDRATDSLPILFSAPAPEDGIAWNKDMHRHVEEPDQMLYDQVAGLIGWARAGSDAQMSIRANTGTGTLCTAAGCKQLLSEFGLPWTTHVGREAIEAFDPADIADRGVLPRVYELYAYFRARLPERIHFYIADTQSPFDLAHLLYGDAIFYDMFDDPDFVHALLAKATALYINGSQLMKSWIREPADGGCHGILWMENGGVRACEDTATLLSPELVNEFVVPYRNQGLAPFGGGWVHYCGDNDEVYCSLLQAPQVRGINFGNPERHDFSRVLPELIEAGKFYYGNPPRLDDESLNVYFHRVLGYTGGARKGLIFVPELRGDEPKEPARVLDLWRSIQS
jgi:hypothetical protein